MTNRMCAASFQWLVRKIPTRPAVSSSSASLTQLFSIASTLLLAASSMAMMSLDGLAIGLQLPGAAGKRASRPFASLLRAFGSLRESSSKASISGRAAEKALVAEDRVEMNALGSEEVFYSVKAAFTRAERSGLAAAPRCPREAKFTCPSKIISVGNSHA